MYYFLVNILVDITTCFSIRIVINKGRKARNKMDKIFRFLVIYSYITHTQIHTVCKE